MATVTQDIATAGSVTIAVTFDNVTGVVISIVANNTAVQHGTFTFTIGGVAHSIPIPPGSSNLPFVTPTIPKMTLQPDGITWDWTYSVSQNWTLETKS